jgi:hypothetical protein
LSVARRDLGLNDAAPHEQVERQLHFRFQRLYRKPPDDWSDAEAAEWDLLASYVDIEAYQDDNPPTDNRIGRLIRVDADKVVIRWNSRGELSHDARTVPPELLTTPEGWLVHAEFQVANGTELWLSTRIAPPVAPDEEVIADDISDAIKFPPAKLSVADWPKLGA